MKVNSKPALSNSLATSVDTILMPPSLACDSFAALNEFHSTDNNIIMAKKVV